MKIIIYGLGKGAEECEKKLRNTQDIIGYTDSFSNFKAYHGKSFICLENISKEKFDYVVVTLNELTAIEKVCTLLIQKYSISPNKIILFWYLQNHERYRYKLKKYSLEKVEGLLFGNSHAMFGFLEDRMKYPAINFAVPSQDLYYDNIILQDCITNYGEQFGNLKYIVIDLYDYNYFNIDVSKGKNFGGYLSWGGVMAHHNKDPYSYACGCIINIDDPAVKQLFAEIGDYVGTDWHENDRWEHITDEEPLSLEVLTGKSAIEEYRETIEENMLIFDQMLSSITRWNPNLKIFLTLCPRFITMEREERKLDVWKKRKEQFIEIINTAINKYGIYYFDFKDREEISENCYLWKDICHLNTIGAGALTEILNSEIEKNI